MTKAKTAPAPDAPFITSDVVASLIGFSNAALFLKAREELETEQAFPEPVPTQRRPLKWRRDAVLAWLDMVAPVHPQPRLTGNVVPLHGGRA